MKNKEKYVDKLADIAYPYIAVDKEGNIYDCDTSLDCLDCIFFNVDEEGCGNATRKWLEQEYSKLIKLTEDEIVILKNISHKYRYIVKDDALWITEYEPYKKDDMWEIKYGVHRDMSMYNHLFDFIDKNTSYHIDDLLESNGASRYGKN